MRARRQRNFCRHQKFFCKNVFRQKGYPLLGGRTIFGQVFGRGGMTEISKRKVPPTGGVQRPATDVAVKLNHVPPSQANASRGNEGASSRADVGAWSRRQP